MSYLRRTPTQEISIRELGGGGDRNDFLEYLEMSPVGDMAKTIEELQDLMSRKPIDRKAGATSRRISKELIY